MSEAQVTHLFRDSQMTTLFNVQLGIKTKHNNLLWWIVNPKNHCYLNSVIQLLLPILRTISYDFQFNSSTEGTLSKYMLETAYNAYSSTDVDVLKFQLVQYNQFYDGKNQQDSSECLLMLIEIINKGSVPYYGSHVSKSTGVSLSDILFSFMLEKYIVCNVCGLRSPSIESSGVLYISPTHTSSMQELIMQGLQQNWKSLAFDVIRTLGMSNQIIFYNLQIIWLLLSIDLDT